MDISRRQVLLTTIAAGVNLCIAHPSSAQIYPARPIRLVIPFPPGGVFDSLGRPWAEHIKVFLGSIVVENIGGAGASLGASTVAHARPDGYTILLGGTLTHINEALLKNKPLYDAVKDLDPVVAVANNCLSIAVHPSVPAQNLAELVTYAKANPGKLSFGHTGVGSINHLAGELFKSLSGATDIAQVPYRGMGPALTDLMGGQIPIAVAGFTGQVLEFHRAGKIRVLAVTSLNRLAAAPDISTAKEAGFPGLTLTATIGLLVPAGTPQPIVDQLAEATRRTLADPTYQKTLIDQGFEPALDSTPEKFRQTLAADISVWRPVVASLGIRIE